MLHDVVIHENEATRIGQVLSSFLEESGVSEALLIDRSGQLLASTGKSPSFDTVSIGVLVVSTRGRVTVSCGTVWAPAAAPMQASAISEHNEPFRCTRYDRGPRAIAAGSQAHRPPVYFTR